MMKVNAAYEELKGTKANNGNEEDAIFTHNLKLEWGRYGRFQNIDSWASNLKDEDSRKSSGEEGRKKRREKKKRNREQKSDL